MAVEFSVWELIWFLVILIISAIPLNIAVKLLGGRSSILKVIFANILAGILAFFIEMFLGGGFWISVLIFIAMLLVYKSMFEMGWIRSFLAWLLQFVIIAIIMIILALLGIGFAWFAFF